MNIEESIEILESYKESLEEYEDNPRIIQAIKTLLTAYEKEKEKNKELEQRLKDIELQILEEE